MWCWGHGDTQTRAPAGSSMAEHQWCPVARELAGVAGRGCAYQLGGQDFAQEHSVPQVLVAVVLQVEEQAPELELVLLGHLQLGICSITPSVSQPTSARQH